MTVSVFDLFRIGIGPSSSHTVGPMRASGLFLKDLRARSHLDQVNRIIVELYGSLALTGVGHGSDKALVLGLEGHAPETIDPAIIEPRFNQVVDQSCLLLGGSKQIEFEPKKHLVFFRKKSLEAHPNGLIFRSYCNEQELLSKTYYSIGGGFVLEETESIDIQPIVSPRKVPFPFSSGAQLIEIAIKQNWSIAELVFNNEMAFKSESEINEKLDGLWSVMNECIERGCKTTGILPGKLKVKRRAAKVFQELSSSAEKSLKDPLTILDWVNLYALAVNEENASGARIVTAPTNGAAGIIPAVIRYYLKFCGGANQQGVRNFLLTAGAIGSLYTQNASISGAEVGCQGEVGVACSMAAGALCAVMGGSVNQVEEAAEIGMEHNLGLTCDPIGGLVQIPCIERNAMAAVKAINAARIALKGTGSHYVSLDSVIKTMRQTGADMKKKYKETSRGGLAVNVTEC